MLRKVTTRLSQQQWMYLSKKVCFRPDKNLLLNCEKLLENRRLKNVFLVLILLFLLVLQNVNEKDDKKRHEIDRHSVEKVRVYLYLALVGNSSTP